MTGWGSWEDDPRPLSECLRAWARGRGWERAQAAEALRAPLGTYHGWAAGRPALAEPMIRRMMDLIDLRQGGVMAAFEDLLARGATRYTRKGAGSGDVAAVLIVRQGQWVTVEVSGLISERDDDGLLLREYRDEVTFREPVPGGTVWWLPERSNSPAQLFRDGAAQLWGPDIEADLHRRGLWRLGRGDDRWERRA